jgi:hypothetical protein
MAKKKQNCAERSRYRGDAAQRLRLSVHFQGAVWSNALGVEMQYQTVSGRLNPRFGRCVRIVKVHQHWLGTLNVGTVLEVDPSYVPSAQPVKDLD